MGDGAKTDLFSSHGSFRMADKGLNNQAEPENGQLGLTEHSGSQGEYPKSKYRTGRQGSRGQLTSKSSSIVQTS